MSKQCVRDLFVFTVSQSGSYSHLKVRKERAELQAAALAQDCGISMQMIDSGAGRKERRYQALGCVR